MVAVGDHDLGEPRRLVRLQVAPGPPDDLDLVVGHDAADTHGRRG
jgi:hypothetical protein